MIISIKTAGVLGDSGLLIFDRKNLADVFIFLSLLRILICSHIFAMVFTDLFLKDTGHVSSPTNIEPSNVSN